ncbi:MAG: hypothetical protein C4326_00340 [Ignavibacteria bacterium]
MSTTRVRYGILGFGRFAAKAIAPAIRQSVNSELIALQNRTLAKAQQAAAGLGMALAFDSPAALIAHPDIDAVFIASPHAQHCEETLLAAAARKHVLCEKPMALSVVECERMIDACARSGVKLMVGHMVRLSPLVQRMRELVLGGAVGDVVRAAADFVYDGRLSTRTWLLDRRMAGGGPTFDVGIHCLDTLRFVLDDEVTALKGEMEPKPTDEHTETSSQLLMRFSRGAIGVIFSSYVAPLRESRIEIIGTEARLSALDFTVGERRTGLLIERRTASGTIERVVETFDIPNLYVEEINHFSSCLLQDTEPVLNAHNALANQRVLDEAMRL